MSGFTKLFSSIVTSSVWVEPDPILRVWIAMLATTDAEGLVEGSVPGFASLARVTTDQMRTAVDKLSSPDPDSRTPDFEGRRIEVIEGGWRILNYRVYRSRAQAKEGSKAPAMRAYRARKRAEDGNALLATVTREPEERRKKSEERVTYTQTAHAYEGFEIFYSEYPKKVAKQRALKAWRAQRLMATDCPRLLAALQRQRHSTEWRKENGQYIPHPATWLNGRRWEDEPLTESSRLAAAAEETTWTKVQRALKSRMLVNADAYGNYFAVARLREEKGDLLVVEVSDALKLERIQTHYAAQVAAAAMAIRAGLQVRFVVREAA